MVLPVSHRKEFSNGPSRALAKTQPHADRCLIRCEYGVVFRQLLCRDWEDDPGPAISEGVLTVQHIATPYKHALAVRSNSKNAIQADSVDTSNPFHNRTSIFVYRAANALERTATTAVQLFRPVIAIQNRSCNFLPGHKSVLLPMSSLSGLTEQRIEGRILPWSTERIRSWLRTARFSGRSAFDCIGAHDCPALSEIFKAVVKQVLDTPGINTSTLVEGPHL